MTNEEITQEAAAIADLIEAVNNGMTMEEMIKAAKEEETNGKR